MTPRVTIRFSDAEEFARFKSQADKAGLPISTYIRQCVLRADMDRFLEVMLNEFARESRMIGIENLRRLTQTAATLAEMAKLAGISSETFAAVRAKADQSVRKFENALDVTEEPDA